MWVDRGILVYVPGLCPFLSDPAFSLVDGSMHPPTPGRDAITLNPFVLDAKGGWSQGGGWVGLGCVMPGEGRCPSLLHLCEGRGNTGDCVTLPHPQEGDVGWGWSEKGTALQPSLLPLTLL